MRRWGKKPASISFPAGTTVLSAPLRISGNVIVQGNPGIRWLT